MSEYVVYAIAISENKSVCGNGKFRDSITFDIGGFLPACNSETIKNSILESSMVLSIGIDEYDIKNVVIIDEDNILLNLRKRSNKVLPIKWAKFSFGIIEYIKNKRKCKIEIDIELDEKLVEPLREELLNIVKKYNQIQEESK